MRIAQNKFVDVYLIDTESVKKCMDNNSSSIHRKYTNFGYITIKT